MYAIRSVDNMTAVVKHLYTRSFMASTFAQGRPDLVRQGRPGPATVLTAADDGDGA